MGCLPAPCRSSDLKGKLGGGGSLCLTRPLGGGKGEEFGWGGGNDFGLVPDS